MGVLSTASTIAMMTANDYKNAQAIYANMQQQDTLAQNGGMGVLTQQALKAASAQNMELLNQQAAQAAKASSGSSSIDSISSSFSDQIQQLTSSNLSVTDQISQITSASGMSASSAAGFSTSTDFTQAIIDSISSASKSSSSSSTNSDVMTSATNMLKTYFKQFCPGMSDEQISAICKFAASQYGDLAKAMDMSSLTSSVMGSSSTGSASSSGSASSVGNNGNYGANKGVSGLLSDAGAMVGMTEQSNAASINKITKKSGINCQTTPWCAAWAMNMLKDHGVLDTSSCSNVNYCPTIVNWAKKENIWAGRGSYTPQAGDAILFDWQGDGTSDHIGIVEKVANGKVYTIEGNSSDSVARRSYSLSSSKVMGYINCAAQK